MMGKTEKCGEGPGELDGIRESFQTRTRGTRKDAPAFQSVVPVLRKI